MGAEVIGEAQQSRGRHAPAQQQGTSLLAVVAHCFWRSCSPRWTRPSCPRRCRPSGELGGLTHLSWVVTAYLLTSAIAGPFYGKFGDIHGRKILLQAAIVLFLLGSALCGVAQNMVQLIAFRALQGIGGGGLSQLPDQFIPTPPGNACRDAR
jgi:MFS family permease